MCVDEIIERGPRFSDVVLIRADPLPPSYHNTFSIVVFLSKYSWRGIFDHLLTSARPLKIFLSVIQIPPSPWGDRHERALQKLLKISIGRGGGRGGSQPPFL